MSLGHSLFKHLSCGVTVIAGCLSVFCLSLVGLIFILQAPLWHSYSSPVLQLHTDIWHYLLVDNGQLLINHAQLNMAAERHMLDVKRILQRLFTATPWITLAFGISLYGCQKQWRRALRGVAHSGGVVLVLQVLLVVLAGFRNVFIHFHALLFLVDTWWFEPDSVLIQAFPKIYFQQFALCWTLLVSALCALLYGISTARWRNTSTPRG